MSLEESRYTPPREWCPNPGYWHSPDSEATEIEVTRFLGSVVRLIQPEYVVETGTYHGHTAFEIGWALHENHHGWLDTIESDRGCWEIAADRVKGLPVGVIFGNTMEFTPRHIIDFLFLDSWQEGRVLEFNRFMEMGMIRPGAIIAVHDTAPHHQVRKTLSNFNPNGGEFVYLDFHTPRGVILGQYR